MHMRLDFRRAFSIAFTWFVSLYGLFFSSLWTIAIIQVGVPAGTPLPGFSGIYLFNTIFYLGLGLAVLAPALISVVISVLVTLKLVDQNDGFDEKQNRVYMVLTAFAVLFICLVSFGYFQSSWVRVFALGSVPGVMIVIWAIQGAYLKPGSTKLPSSSQPPVRPQSVPPATEPQNLVEPSDMPTPQS